MDFLPEKLDDYIVVHSQAEPQILKELNRETWQTVLNPRMLSGGFQGRVLSMISKLIQPKNILEIISIAENAIISEDLEIEVEYQDSTIGKYGLSFNGENFILKSKTTNCLAEDNCGIPNSKPKVSLSKLQDENCSPGSGCC